MSQGNFYGKREFPSKHHLLIPSNARFTVEVAECHIENRELDDEELLGLIDGTLLPAEVTITLDVFGDGEQLIVEKYMGASPVPFNANFVKETKHHRDAMARAAIAWFSLDK